MQARLIPLLLIFWAGAAAASPLSFTAARAALYERSDQLHAAQARVNSKEAAAESIKNLGGPTLSVQAVQIAGEKSIDISRNISLPGLPISVPLSIDEKLSLNGPRAMATATWPVYTGGRISAKQQAAKYAVDQARAQKSVAADTLDAQLAGLYFGLQLAISVEKLRKDTLAQQDLEVKRALRFEKQGLISKVERMSVQVARDAAKTDYLKARDNTKVARQQLAGLLRDGTFSELTTPLFVLKRPLEPLKFWVDAALSSNPNIAMVSAIENQARQGLKAAKGAWMPEVFAFGQYNFIRHYQSLVEPDWIAGIGVNLTLWDAKDRRASVRSAEATLKEAQSGQAEARNQVRTATETAWLKTNNALEQYRLTASAVGLAQENLKLRSKGFAEGLSTSLDVTEARNQLLKAETGRRLAAFDFVANYAILHAVCGKMNDFLSAVDNKQVIFEN